MTVLERRVTPGLAFRFEALPEVLAAEIAAYLEYDLGPEAGGEPPLTISGDPPPAETAATVVLDDEGLTVRRDGDFTLFETEGIVGWCDGIAGAAGIACESPTPAAARVFVSLALAPLLIELAEPHGWLGLHAAAVAVGERGLLLPGASGCGKTTTFGNCAQAGLDVLSDDLVWLREGDDGGFRVHPFPRGFGGGDVPAPTIPGAALTAIACPSIHPRPSSRLVALPAGRALDALLSESGFLGPPAAAGGRFRALARLAGAVPAYGLEAGRRPVDVPSLLKLLLAETPAAPL